MLWMKRLVRRTHLPFALAIAVMLTLPWAVFASQVDVSVVGISAPIDAVTLVAGGSAAITINMSVTGNQAGTATFEVYRDWLLEDGAFTGSNPQEFVVAPRAGGDPATEFSTSGTVSVAAAHANGTFTLEVGAFDITNSNPTGAKLEAGNASSYAVTVEVPFAVDETDPTITITTPADGVEYILGQEVLADYTCQDEDGGSGLATCEGDVANGAAIDTSSVGPKSFTVNASDNAGNTAEVTHDYSVIYDFSGFLSPLAHKTTAKAGSAIPVKFSLDGDQGLGIFSDGFPKSTRVDCENAPASGDAETIATAGNSSLSYDPITDEYTYVWKSDKGWAGTCRLLTVQLIDGTIHSIEVNFKK